MICNFIQQMYPLCLQGLGAVLVLGIPKPVQSKVPAFGQPRGGKTCGQLRGKVPSITGEVCTSALEHRGREWEIAFKSTFGIHPLCQLGTACTALEVTGRTHVPFSTE